MPALCRASSGGTGLVLTTVAAILTSCATSPSTPEPTVPGRVVALAPSLTEVVYGLGEGDRLVGVCAQCDYPEEAKQVPRVGGYLSPSVEEVLGVRPDLVLAVPSPGNREAVRALERAGVRVLVAGDRTLDDLWTSIAAVADALGVPDRGAAMTSQVRADLQAVHDRVRGLPPRRVLLVVGHRPLIVAGGGTLQDELVRIAGGVNVAADAGSRIPAGAHGAGRCARAGRHPRRRHGKRSGGRELFAAFGHRAGRARRPDRARSRRMRSSAPARGSVRRRPCWPSAIHPEAAGS